MTTNNITGSLETIEHFTDVRQVRVGGQETTETHTSSPLQGNPRYVQDSRRSFFDPRVEHRRDTPVHANHEQTFHLDDDESETFDAKSLRRLRLRRQAADSLLIPSEYQLRSGFCTAARYGVDFRCSIDDFNKILKANVPSNWRSILRSIFHYQNHTAVYSSFIDYHNKYDKMRSEKFKLQGWSELFSRRYWRDICNTGKCIRKIAPQDYINHLDFCAQYATAMKTLDEMGSKMQGFALDNPRVQNIISILLAIEAIDFSDKFKVIRVMTTLAVSNRVFQEAVCAFMKLVTFDPIAWKRLLDGMFAYKSRSETFTLQGSKMMEFKILKMLGELVSMCVGSVTLGKSDWMSYLKESIAVRFVTTMIEAGDVYLHLTKFLTYLIDVIKQVYETGRLDPLYVKDDITTDIHRCEEFVSMLKDPSYLNVESSIVVDIKKFLDEWRVRMTKPGYGMCANVNDNFKLLEARLADYIKSQDPVKVAPIGLVLMGDPGTGKSAFAKALSVMSAGVAGVDPRVNTMLCYQEGVDHQAPIPCCLVLLINDYLQTKDAHAPRPTLSILQSYVDESEVRLNCASLEDKANSVVKPYYSIITTNTIHFDFTSSEGAWKLNRRYRVLELIYTEAAKKKAAELGIPLDELINTVGNPKGYVKYVLKKIVTPRTVNAWDLKNHVTTICTFDSLNECMYFFKRELIQHRERSRANINRMTNLNVECLSCFGECECASFAQKYNAKPTVIVNLSTKSRVVEEEEKEDAPPEPLPVLQAGFMDLEEESSDEDDSVDVYPRPFAHQDIHRVYLENNNEEVFLRSNMVSGHSITLHIPKRKQEGFLLEDMLAHYPRHRQTSSDSEILEYYVRHNLLRNMHGVYCGVRVGGDNGKLLPIPIELYGRLRADDHIGVIGYQVDGRTQYCIEVKWKQREPNAYISTYYQPDSDWYDALLVAVVVNKFPIDSTMGFKLCKKKDSFLSFLKEYKMELAGGLLMCTTLLWLLEVYRGSGDTINYEGIVHGKPINIPEEYSQQPSVSINSSNFLGYMPPAKAILYTIMCKSQNRRMYCSFLTEGIIVVNAHFFLDMPSRRPVVLDGMTLELTDSNSSQRHAWKFDKCFVEFHLTGIDGFALLRVNIPGIKSEAYIMPKLCDETPQVNDYLYVNNRPTRVLGLESDAIRVANNFTVAGDCGSYYWNVSHIYAIHAARSTSDIGVGIRLKKSTVLDVLSKLNRRTGGATVLKSQLVLQHFSQMEYADKSDIGKYYRYGHGVPEGDDMLIVGARPRHATPNLSGKRTALYESFKERLPLEFCRPKTKAFQNESGIWTGATLSLVQAPVPEENEVDPVIMHRVINLLFEKFKPLLVKTKPTTKHEAFVGVGQCPAINAMATDKSVGFHLKQVGVTNSNIFTQSGDAYSVHEKFLQAIAEEEMRYCEEVYYNQDVVMAQIKDEVLPADKVASGKSRLFYIPEKVFNFQLKRYFSPLLNLLYSNPEITGMYSMMNAASSEWSRMGEHLSSFGRMLDGDHSKFDLHHVALIPYVQMFLRMMLEEIGYSQEDIGIAMTLIHKCFSGYLLVDDVLFEKLLKMFSGNYLTLFLNNIFNLLAMHYCIQKMVPDKNVVDILRMAINGDDSLTSIRFDVASMLEDKLDFITVIMSELGYVFTTASKVNGAGLVFMPLSEVSFCKRGFKYHEEIGGIVGCLDLKSVVKTLCYETRSSVSSEEREVQAVASSFRELFLHGREVFNDWVKLLPPRLVLPFTYEELLIEYKAEKFKTWTGSRSLEVIETDCFINEENY